jgi:Raf kinase inhibitor-like YbhB/YbcL family protein
MQQFENQHEYKVLIITSTAFNESDYIPALYTCEGEDINPPLDIKEIPEEAKSLVLIMEGTVEPKGIQSHWLVWNIPITHHIKENEIPGEQGMNDFGRINYGGPCPPSGTHRYIFKVYALETLLDLHEGSMKKDLENAMSSHIVAYGELVGLYKKINPI